MQLFDYLVRPERLLAAAPLGLRFAPARRRCAATSNFAFGEVVELGLLSVGGSNPSVVNAPYGR